MSENERREMSLRLQKALKESFYKMLSIKQKLGQDIVTSDGKGNPIVITAEEAWEMIHKKE